MNVISPFSRVRQTRIPYLATWVMLGTIALSAAIAAAWFTGVGTISTIFMHLNELEQNPPMWIAAPMMFGQYLAVPAVALMILVLMITKISSRPRPWSRAIVVSILLFLAVRYLLWRSLSTLNFSTPLNGVFSLGLLMMELALLSGGNHSTLVVASNSRSPVPKPTNWRSM